MLTHCPVFVNLLWEWVTALVQLIVQEFGPSLPNSDLRKWKKPGSVWETPAEAGNVSGCQFVL